MAMMHTGQRAQVGWERIKGGSQGKWHLNWFSDSIWPEDTLKDTVGSANEAPWPSSGKQSPTACSHIPPPGSSWHPVQERRLSGSDSQVLSTQAGRQMKH